MTLLESCLLGAWRSAHKSAHGRLKKKILHMWYVSFRASLMGWQIVSFLHQFHGVQWHWQTVSYTAQSLLLQLSEEEVVKVENRRVQNRVAAQRFRERQKLRAEELQKVQKPLVIRTHLNATNYSKVVLRPEFCISWFTNPPTVIFRKVEKNKIQFLFFFFILSADSKYYFWEWHC